MNARQYRQQLLRELRKAVDEAKKNVETAIDGDGYLNGVGWGELSSFANGLEKAILIANAIPLSTPKKASPL